jgi:hypothetical protein
LAGRNRKIDIIPHSLKRACRSISPKKIFHILIKVLRFTLLFEISRFYVAFIQRTMKFFQKVMCNKTGFSFTPIEKLFDWSYIRSP